MADLYGLGERVATSLALCLLYIHTLYYKIKLALITGALAASRAKRKSASIALVIPPWITPSLISNYIKTA